MRAEQEPCDKCVYSTRDGYCQYDDIAETIPPLEPCDDVVGRQAVLETINNNTADERDGWLCIDNDLVYEIEKLPSVRPQEQTGKWISLDDFRGKYNENGFMCSKCGEHSDFEENYCPNCGARMVEPYKSKDKE